MNLVVYLLLAPVLVACRTSPTVINDAASAVVGRYEVFYLKKSGSNGPTEYDLPYMVATKSSRKMVSGQLIATRKNANTVGVVFLKKQTDDPNERITIGNLDVRGTGLYSGDTKVGTADGTSLSVEAVDRQGTHMTVRGKKQ